MPWNSFKHQAPQAPYQWHFPAYAVSPQIDKEKFSQRIKKHSRKKWFLREFPKRRYVKNSVCL